MPGKKGDSSGRKLALTILIGVFIAIMVITLFNLLVSYFYEPPEYDKFCNFTDSSPYPVKVGYSNCAVNCTFSQVLQDEQDKCVQQRGMAIFSYDSNGCASSLKNCDMCSVNFENSMKEYNRSNFFIYALIGFALIVAGLFIHNLLIQIITLPSGAFLVIEAAVKNFDDKLYVIIVFALLIVAATYLAVKKLK